jgi:hypothetical protein
LGPKYLLLTSLFDLWGYLIDWKMFIYSLPITFLNVYGPCTEKRAFWDNLADSGILEAENLIIVGDLNITLSAEEVWGSTNFSVSLADHLKALFQSKNLVDICPDRLVPTWRNGRQGSQAIAKRLDRCLLSDSLLISKEFYRSWVEYLFISDHAPIIFQMDLVAVNKNYPFKFNPLWLMDVEFSSLVNMVWKDEKYLTEEGFQRRLVWKLKDLKKQTKLWARRKEEFLAKRLDSLEAQIKENLLLVVEENTNYEKEIILGNLEKERNEILSYNEEKWRQRSRAIWIRSGDSNTKFFHHYANQRRIHKHIWELVDDDGQQVKGQADLKKAATKYFRNFYKARDDSFNSEKIEVTELFPRMVQTEDIDLLMKPVSADEIKNVLKLFQRDKSPGPDGWTVEFFSYFFDLVSDDLVQMVEESRMYGNIPGCLNSTFLALIPKENNPTTFGDYRPISLCNLCYKLISKIISNRIKPIMSRKMSEEHLDSWKGEEFRML